MTFFRYVILLNFRSNRYIDDHFNNPSVKGSLRPLTHWANIADLVTGDLDEIVITTMMIIITTMMIIITTIITMIISTKMLIISTMMITITTIIAMIISTIDIVHQPKDHVFSLKHYGAKCTNIDLRRFDVRQIK